MVLVAGHSQIYSKDNAILATGSFWTVWVTLERHGSNPGLRVAPVASSNVQFSPVSSIATNTFLALRRIHDLLLRLNDHHTSFFTDSSTVSEEQQEAILRIIGCYTGIRNLQCVPLLELQGCCAQTAIFKDAQITLA